MPDADYLTGLNAEHGVAGYGASIDGRLLVIAGAGAGKTNTLARRVAHLIVNGADPGRILLLTFSCRAVPTSFTAAASVDHVGAVSMVVSIVSRCPGQPTSRA